MKKLLVVALFALSACKTVQVVEDATPPSLPAEDFVVVSQNLTQVDVKYTGSVEAGTDALITDDGLASAFIAYELGSRVNPHVTLTLEDAQRKLIETYVGKYVLKPAKP